VKDKRIAPLNHAVGSLTNKEQALTNQEQTSFGKVLFMGADPWTHFSGMRCDFAGLTIGV
jgi:hypothetical protein